MAYLGVSIIILYRRGKILGLNMNLRVWKVQMSMTFWLYAHCVSQRKCLVVYHLSGNIQAEFCSHIFETIYKTPRHQFILLSFNIRNPSVRKEWNFVGWHYQRGRREPFNLYFPMRDLHGDDYFSCWWCLGGSDVNFSRRVIHKMSGKKCLPNHDIQDLLGCQDH